MPRDSFLSFICLKGLLSQLNSGKEIDVNTMLKNKNTVSTHILLDAKIKLQVKCDIFR